MKWLVVFDEPRGVAIVTTSGTFNPVDHARMVADIVGRPEWRPGHPVLFDHRKLDFGTAGYQQLFVAGGNHRAYEARIGNAPSAILMKSLDDVGVGRQFQNIVVGRVTANLAVFVDEDEAWRWLGEALGER